MEWGGRGYFGVLEKCAVVDSANPKSTERGTNAPNWNVLKTQDSSFRGGIDTGTTLTPPEKVVSPLSCSEPGLAAVQTGAPRSERQSVKRNRVLRRSALRIQAFRPWLHALDNIGQAVIGWRFPFALILFSLRATGGLLPLLVQPLHFLLALLKCSRHGSSFKLQGQLRTGESRACSYQRGSRGWRVASR
jgi:hypothetical protein